MRFFSKPRLRAGVVLAATLVAFGLIGVAASAAPRTNHAEHVSNGSARIHQSRGGEWVGTWAASPQAANPEESPLSFSGFSDQTVRNIVYAAVGGNEIRVRFSNAYGQKPLVIGSASIAIDLQGAQLVPGTLHSLTFAGNQSATIPAGRELYSDPVSFRFEGQQDLAVSLFLPDATGPATYHNGAQQDNFVSTSGDFSRDPTASAFPTYTSTTTSWFFVDGVDVIPSSPDVVGSVVAFGDSITDGATVGNNSNDRWPNILGNRLAAVHGHTLSVVDEGITGNRVLNGSPCFGDSALGRFSRDVLDQSGVRDVIVLEGVNDIGFSNVTSVTAPPGLGPCFVPNTNVSAEQIINGFQQLIAAAHARGLKVFGATITPFKGLAYWDPAAEKKRHTINHWILTSGAFDRVIDFAAVLADPYDPDIMNPIYDSGDHLHPNDAGYVAMGNAIDLRMLLHK